MTTFDKAWDIVKNDSNEDEWRPDTTWNIHPKWDNFNPDHDTCTGCGGQMTPHWPGYGPDGPENGNCDSELPECDLNHMFRQMKEAGHWGQLGLPHDWDDGEMIEWIHRERGKGNHDFPDEINFEGENPK